jgi:hypothetical protein
VEAEGDRTPCVATRPALPNHPCSQLQGGGGRGDFARSADEAGRTPGRGGQRDSRRGVGRQHRLEGSLREAFREGAQLGSTPFN